MSQREIVIVGAGLAGSAAAILLHAAGHEVTLLERHHYPRHKMCGEFLSPEAVPIFQRLGVWQTIQAARPAPLTAARITTPRGDETELPLPRPAWGFSRFRLDALLLERARAVGVNVQEGCVVRHVSGSLQQGFAVETREETMRTRVVLGAWGKRSTLDRTLERPFFARRAGFLALKAHFGGPDPGSRTELHTFPGGYCGINRVEGDAVNVCLLASDAAWARSGQDVATFWQMIQQENPALRAQLAGAEKLSEDIVISNISFQPKAAVVQQILLLGDSAALISPLAGNGQAMALQAAELAAPLVTAFLHGQLPAAALPARYQRLWQSRFRERLLLGRLLQPLFLQPRALALGLRLVRAVPPLGRWLVAGTRERGMPRAK